MSPVFHSELKRRKPIFVVTHKKKPQYSKVMTKMGNYFILEKVHVSPHSPYLSVSHIGGTDKLHS